MTKPLYEESDPEIFSQCNVLPFYVASTRIYVTKYKLLFFFFFGHPACGILVPQPRTEPIPLHWKHGVLTAHPPEKSQLQSLNILKVLSEYSLLSSFPL